MIGVGDKVQVPAGTICRFRHVSYRTDVSFEGEVTVLDTDYALILPSKESDYARNILEDERIRYAWVAVKDLNKICPTCKAEEAKGEPVNIKVGDKVKIPAQTLYRVPPNGKQYFTTVALEGMVKELLFESNIAIIDVGIWRMRVALKDLIKVEEPSCVDKPTGFISIGFIWRVKAVRVHESDDTKAEITITGGESESVDGAVYLTVTRAEAKAIHLGDVYVVSIRRKGD